MYKGVNNPKKGSIDLSKLRSDFSTENEKPDLPILWKRIFLEI
jgi:hypothetical protein